MRGLPPLGLGHPRTELRRRLVEAALRGARTATAGLFDEHAADDEGVGPDTRVVAGRFRVVERP